MLKRQNIKWYFSAVAYNDVSGDSLNRKKINMDKMINKIEPSQIAGILVSALFLRHAVLALNSLFILSSTLFSIVGNLKETLFGYNFSFHISWTSLSSATKTIQKVGACSIKPESDISQRFKPAVSPTDDKTNGCTYFIQ